jgi:hypothetical protein
MDIAWDAAAISVEWGLEDSGRALLIRELRDANLIRRLPFYEAAYSAFRAAYAAMAAGSLAECADAHRFRLLEQRYTSRLAQSLTQLEKVGV